MSGTAVGRIEPVILESLALISLRAHLASALLNNFPMAKTCWLEREKRKSKCVAKYAAIRAELKKKGDYIGLSMLPRNASPVRLSRRCNATGRKRAFIGRFQLSRISLREMASNGLIPGVTKSSW